MIKKFGKNILFFVILFVLTFYLLFKEQDVMSIFGVIKTAKLYFILLGIASMFIYLLLESLNTKMLMKKFGTDIGVLSCLKYSFIGFFYSSITPSSSGGQPMQIYHMKKDNIDISKSTIALLLQASAYHIINLLYMVIGSICNFTYLGKNMNSFTVLVIIGIIIKLSVLTVILSAIFLPKSEKVIKRGVLFFVDKLKLKNKDNIIKKLDDFFEGTNQCSSYLKKNKIVFLKVLILMFFEMTFFYSITYITVLAFGIKGISYFKVLTLQAVLFSGISSIPLPGTMGVNEVGFQVLFAPIFGKSKVPSAVLLSRFMSFYLFVIVSGIIAIITYINQHKNGND